MAVRRYSMAIEAVSILVASIRAVEFQDHIGKRAHCRLAKVLHLPVNRESPYLPMSPIPASRPDLVLAKQCRSGRLEMNAEQRRHRL